jgi:hydroxymethylglutaryl-CoA reductase (NADPH)
MNLRNSTSVSERRQIIEQETSASLFHIGSSTLDDAVASSRNCENMIGYTQIPVGIAGPLKVKSEKLEVKSYYLPLSTTEGALVASVNRGCKAISQSGGATATAFRIGTTRGAVFSHDRKCSCRFYGI